jgi:hypothetical protein
MRITCGDIVGGTLWECTGGPMLNPKHKMFMFIIVYICLFISSIPEIYQVFTNMDPGGFLAGTVYGDI